MKSRIKLHAHSPLSGSNEGYGACFSGPPNLAQPVQLDPLQMDVNRASCRQSWLSAIGPAALANKFIEKVRGRPFAN